jgi:pimeloyl-ACP methyl ester carboxylesterase
VWKVVEDKKLNKPVIAGHSLGGHLALRIGADHADRVRAVIAIDGAPAFPYLPASAPPAQRIEMARQMAGSFDVMTDEQWMTNQKQMVTSMVTDPARAEQLVAICTKVPRPNTVQYFSDLLAADIRDQLAKLNAPTLVMASAATSNVAGIKTISKTWMDLLQNAPKLTFVVFENTRHFIQDDRPEELDAAIADFLAGREVKGYTAPPTTKPATSMPGMQPK